MTWNSFEEHEQERLAQRMSIDLGQADRFFQIRLLKILRMINKDYCEKVRKAIKMEQTLCQ